MGNHYRKLVFFFHLKQSQIKLLHQWNRSDLFCLIVPVMVTINLSCVFSFRHMYPELLETLQSSIKILLYWFVWITVMLHTKQLILADKSMYTWHFFKSSTTVPSDYIWLLRLVLKCFKFKCKISVKKWHAYIHKGHVPFNQKFWEFRSKTEWNISNRKVLKKHLPHCMGY